MCTVIDYAGGEVAWTEQWDEAKACARDDYIGSLTQFIAQVSHITNTILSGQTSAYETNMKQACHGLQELGFSPKSQVRRKKSKCFVLSYTCFSDHRQQKKHTGIQRRSHAQILTKGHRVFAPSYTWTTDNPQWWGTACLPLSSPSPIFPMLYALLQFPFARVS